MRFLRNTFLLTIVCSLSQVGAWAQWQRQVVRLTPGWNAVFIEVQPEPGDLDTAFKGVPVESAWLWNRPGQSIEFIDDANRLIPGKPDWLTYLPLTHPQAAVRNLFEVPGGRALIVNLGGGIPVDWVLVGRPTAPKFNWVSDSYNLVGFPLGESATHSFTTLFANSSAHANGPVLKLNSQGEWTRVLDLSAERVQSGRAYWIFSSGASRFSGPFEITTDQGLRIAYGDGLVLNTLRLSNPDAASRIYQMELLPSSPSPTTKRPVAGPVPLSYRRFVVNGVTGEGSSQWTRLTNQLTLTVPAGQALALPLEVLRPELGTNSSATVGEYQSLLSVSDTNGYRLILPVSVRGSATAAADRGAGRLKAASVGNVRDPRAGLWVGNVTLDQVNFTAHPSDPDKLRPAKSEFDFRILIHVDDEGKARLLQHAMVMWRQTNATPGTGRLVVATDEELASRSGFTGVALRGDRPVVRRFTAPAFGFREPILMEADGAFGSGVFRCSTTMPYNDPLNPFKHVFHPDHDNLDPTTGEVLPEGVESFSVSRQIELQFSEKDPALSGATSGQHIPGFGDTRLGGVYNETILGVHRRLVRIQGSFTLQRSVSVGLLNDGETN